MRLEDSMQVCDNCGEDGATPYTPHDGQTVPLCEDCREATAFEDAQSRLESESEWHSDYGPGANPAVNVKLRTWPQAAMLEPNGPEYVAAFDRATDRDSEIAWEDVSEIFWHESYLGSDVTPEDNPYTLADMLTAYGLAHLRPRMYSEGRQGGWLVYVSRDWGSWGPDDVNRWLEFAAAVRVVVDTVYPQELAYQTAWQTINREDGERADKLAAMSGEACPNCGQPIRAPRILAYS